MEASPSLPDSPSSPHMFELSPEVQLQGGLGVSAAHAAFGSVSHAAALDEEGSEDDSDDLTAFLAGLREKYGLQDAPAVPPPAPAPALAAEPEAVPAVCIRVQVTSTSTAGGGEVTLPPAPAMPQRSPSKVQRTGPEGSGAGPPMPQLPFMPPPAAQQVEQLLQQGSSAKAAQQQEPQQPQPRPQPQPQPQPEEAPEAELLDAELDAELTALEELQRQLDQRQLGPSSSAAPMQQQEPAAALQQPGAATAALSSLPAAAAAHAVEHHGSTEVEDAVESAQPAGAPQLRLPWASLHELLVERGFPGVLPANTADVGAGSYQPQESQPDPAALFTALHSLLQEQARAKLHQERLAEAAKGAARREAALVSSFTTAAKQRDAEIAKWKRLALDNQRAARDAQQAGGSLSQSREQLVVEVRQLQGTVARLQAALHRKVSHAGTQGRGWCDACGAGCRDVGCWARKAVWHTQAVVAAQLHCALQTGG